MQIQGPERYRLTFTPDPFKVLCPKGTDKFPGIRLRWHRLHGLSSDVKANIDGWLPEEPPSGGLPVSVGERRGTPRATTVVLLHAGKGKRVVGRVKPVST
jgi:hypothetical protein